MIHTTIFNFDLQRKLDLTPTEYCVVFFIYLTSHKGKKKCFFPKSVIADSIAISKSCVIKAIKNRSDLIVKSDSGKGLLLTDQCISLMNEMIDDDENYINDYIDQDDSDIPEFHPIVKKEPVIGFIYAAIDHNTNLYKVGFSKTPAVRERTLQSEKPTIEFIAIANGFTISQERKIHDRLANYRIRGEWFNCDFNTIRLSFIELFGIDMDKCN